MNASYQIACCWSGRLESTEQFARRSADWFHELSRIDPVLKKWYLLAKTAREAVEFCPTVEVLRDFLTESSRFVAWNGRDEPDHCYTSMSSEWCEGIFPAMCTLATPREEGAFTERLLKVEVLDQLLRAMVRVWEPDWARIIGDKYLDVLRDSRGKIPKVYCAWLTYLSARRGKVPPLPAPVRVEPVEDKGSLIILTPERFTVANPAHVSLALEVQRLLGEAGLLGPVQ